MDIPKPSMGEGAARFWIAVFGGITAIGLVAAGIYTLFQYIDAKKKDRDSRDKDRAAKLQIATTKFAAKQAFNGKHLTFFAWPRYRVTRHRVKESKAESKAVDILRVRSCTTARALRT